MGSTSNLFIGFSMILSLVVLSSCEKVKPPADAVVLARVGNEFLTLDYALNRIPDFLLNSDSTTAVNEFRDEWIRKRLLYLEAHRLGLYREPAISQRLKRSEVEILSQVLIDLIIMNSPDLLEVTPSDVRDYYERNRDQFVLQERYVRLRHLTAESLDNARIAKEELLRGVPWENVVDRYSINKDETLERAQRFFPVSSLFNDNPPMRQYLGVIGITEISPIRGHDGTFHFIQITEDKPRGDHPDIDLVFEQIKDWLSLEKKRRFVRSYQQNLLIQAEANNEIELYSVIQ
jgi:hypothetical protein